MELGGSQVRGPFKKRGDFPLLPLFSGMVYWLRVDRVVKTTDVHQAYWLRVDRVVKTTDVHQAYWLRVDRVVKTTDVHQALSCDKRSNLYKFGIFL